MRPTQDDSRPIDNESGDDESVVGGGGRRIGVRLSEWGYGAGRRSGEESWRNMYLELRVPGSSVFFVWFQGRDEFVEDGSFAFGSDVWNLFDVTPDKCSW